MPKINQEEYEILKTKLREGYKWVTREMALNQWVRVYKRHPDTGFPGLAFPKANDMFVFVKVGEEPYNIAELIEEYESEETEVKNIEELKSWFEDGKLYVGEYVKHKINQLDEPEVLMQELPVIPKFVANWIEEVKPDNSLRVAFEYIAQQKRDSHDDELAFWVEEGNSEASARAWLDGYTAEEEKIYYVLNTEGETMLRKNDSGVRTSSGFKIKKGFKNENYKLTEQEIKDYDPRYWAFRKPVEELEK